MDKINNQKSDGQEYTDTAQNDRGRTTSAPVRDEHGLTPEERKQIDARIEEAEESLKSGKRTTLEDMLKNVKSKIRRKHEIQNNSR